MIWLKRLLPFAILIAIVLSVHLLRLHEISAKAQLEKKYADVAARVWVGSATYRDNQDRFKQYRDSILKANGITIDEMYKFIKRHKEAPEAIDQFAYKLKASVDSMVFVQDSILKAVADSTSEAKARTKAKDSLKN